MKKIVTMAISLMLSSSSFSGVNIITDFDDTIRITDSGNLFWASLRAIFRDGVYTGIPEFLEESRNYVDKVHVVTASPDVIIKKVRRVLKEESIRADSVYMRSSKKSEGKLDFKVRIIKELMDSDPRDVILMGDDLGNDPEVFIKVRELFPKRILAAYVHVVDHKLLPEGVIPYWTSHDLAIHEYQSGRMSKDSALRVLNSVATVKKIKKVFPRFADCPKNSFVWDWQRNTDFALEVDVIIKKLTDYCVEEE